MTPPLCREIADGADMFIHLAGVTFPRSARPLPRPRQCSRRCARSRKQQQTSGAKFVHASSMSAREPDVSHLCAQSKRESETAVEAASGDNAMGGAAPAGDLRPGRSRATLPYFKLVKVRLRACPGDNAAGPRIASSTSPMRRGR